MKNQNNIEKRHKIDLYCHSSVIFGYWFRQVSHQHLLQIVFNLRLGIKF